VSEFLIRKPIPTLKYDSAYMARWFNSIWIYCQGSNNISPVKTAAFTVDLVTMNYPCNTTSAGFTATLPPALGLKGKPYWFKNVGSANTLTVSRAGTDTIDTGTTLALTAGQAATLVSDGVSKWYQVDSIGSGGGGTITVQEEGVTQSTTVTTLNFVGAAVTASGAGATETITVSALLPANNLSDVVNAVTSFDNLRFQTLGGTSPSSRSTRTKMQEIAISVKDFGALGDASTNDTTAFQNAIDYVNSLGGGTVYVPVARYALTGTLTLKANVKLVGVPWGGGEASANPGTTTIAPTLLITNTTTTFIQQQTGTGWPGNNTIANLVFYYPSQIGPTSSSALTVYPYTITLDQGAALIDNCWFVNCYDGIFCHNGRITIRNCKFGSLHYGITLDRAIDWIVIDGCLWSPYWDYVNSVAWPHATGIDNTIKTNGSTCIRILRADGPMLSNLLMFGTNQYGIYLDAGTETSFTGPSYGEGQNIDIDSLECAIYAKETLGGSSGWVFTNLNIGSNSTATIKGGFYLASGGSDPPQITATNGRFRTGGSTPTYTINAGTLVLTNWWTNSTVTDLPGGALTAPAVPASTTVHTSTFPFRVCVYVAGGTVSAIDVQGTATGMTGGAIIVPPQGTIKLTYTVAPTWTWFAF
jgi:hypothetical protein